MITPYQIFYDEIPNILKYGPKSHREIANQLQQDYPEYCDDSISCPHRNDDSIQTEWDHLARSAEQALKRKGIIVHNAVIKKWQLA